VAPNVRTFLFLAKNIIIIAVVCQIDIYIFSIAVVVNSDAFQSMISSLPFSSPLLSSPLLSSTLPDSLRRLQQHRDNPEKLHHLFNIACRNSIRRCTCGII
jgi:hypothetical protein